MLLIFSACCFASSLHFEPHALHILIWAHHFAYMLDHDESEPEELQEQAQAENTNPNPEQGKPQCI
jgi:hypothetical protein